MATVKDTFNAVITEAMKNAELVTDNYQKAMALAAVAQALATTGLVSDVKVEATEEKAEPKKTKKTADKMKRQPKELPPEENKEEAPATEEKSIEKKASAKEEAPKTWTEEWTEEACDFFADQLEYISNFVENWGEEAANSCLSDFSDGVLKDITADVNPMNIDGIVKAFQELEKEAEAEA